MQLFNIGGDFAIACDWKKTRSGFRHEATLLQNGREVDYAKVCYTNRTWEAYEYQSVMHKLIENTGCLTDEEKKNAISILDGSDGYSGAGNERALAPLKAIGMIAALGSVLGEDQNGANDWKARMLRAGLGDAGLSMPDDWDTLSEDEKQRRLDGAIAQLKA